MNITKHTKSRQAQRGISSEDVGLILDHGDYRHRPGGAVEYCIDSAEVEQLYSHHKKILDTLCKIRGKAVVMSHDGAVVTVYRKKT